VPGVGPVVALTAIAVFADVHRFASAKHVASYAGLVPSTPVPSDSSTIPSTASLGLVRK
jgi:transposase